MTTNSSVSDFSDPLASMTQVTGLTMEQSQRLSSLLDQYLSLLEQGEAPNTTELCREHPDLETAFRAYVAKLDELYSAAGLISPVTSMSQLGDYKILRVVGHGGMGIVYEAEQTSLGRRVALKLLPLAAGLNQRQIQRFKNESRAAAQLQHPHIVPVYGVGEQRGIHYYAMQFIDGYALDQSIETAKKSSEKIAWRPAIEHAADAAEALHFAHQCGIVHRDIKPSNLMLDVNDKMWVTDFGLARSQSDQSLTCSGDLIGTMRYMSPEQASGRQEWVDHRTDIYSLGVTIYEWLTLRPAIDADQSVGLLKAIEHTSPPSLRKLRPDIPADLSVVLDKAMSKLRDDRYETAEQFAHDLRAVAANRPALARPLSLAAKASRWMVRHRNLVAAALAVLCCACIGLATSVLLITQQARIAAKNSELAETYFRQAHSAVDQLGTSIAEELANIPGAEADQLRRRLLQETLTYYQDFATNAESDPEVQADLAATQNRIGVLTREMEGSQKAIEYFEIAAVLYQMLVRQQPQNFELARIQASNLNQLGVAYAELGRPQDAARCYIKANEILTTLNSQKDLQQAEQTAIQTELLLTQSNIGSAQRQLGFISESQKNLQEVVGAFEQRVAEAPDDLLAYRGLSAALTNLSATLTPSNTQESVELLEQALSWQLKYSQKLRNPTRINHELVETYNLLGIAYRSQNRFDEAEKMLTEAIKIEEKLSALFPNSLDYKSDLSMSLANLGEIYIQQRQFSKAHEVLIESVAKGRNVVAESTNSIIAADRFSKSLVNLSLAQRELGSENKAIESLTEAVAVGRKAVEQSPNNSARNELLANLSNYCEELLRLNIRNENWNEALKAALDYYQVTAIDLKLGSQATNKLMKAATALPDVQRRELQRTIETMHQEK